MSVKKVLEGILRSGSSALYPSFDARVASDALDHAAGYSIESWDGYLVALTRSLGSTVVYSVDEGLRKVKEITVVNPFKRDLLKLYHEFLETRLT